MLSQTMSALTYQLADHYDTIVVGAGPAGILAAACAAARGDVLLLDSASLPRNKSCGGMLNEYAQSFLAEYGGVPESILRKPRYVHFRYVDWDRGIRRPTELSFLNVDRIGFDDWLLTLLPSNVTVAGTTALAGFCENATGIEARVNTGETEASIRCRNLIGADGARSSVRRLLGIGSVATYVTLQDFCRLRSDIEPYFDCIYMRDIGDSYAYSYVVPKGEVAIVGSVFYPKTRRPHEKHEATLAALRESLPQLEESVKREAAVALCVRSPRDVVPGRGRVLLAGEAGGYMSPTSGEGISYAMNSGRLAGRAVAENDPASALPAYVDSSAQIAANIRRKLRWLPLMESETGKYLAGFVPTRIVSQITKGL